MQRLPVEKLATITSPWPFSQWGINIVGPQPIGKGQVKFLLVAIDYFIKWVEAEALATITKAKIRSFVWKNIICKFRIPMTIILDNGRQFTTKVLEISIQTSALETNSHPQGIHRRIGKRK